MTFKIIKQDEKVVSTIMYICECIDDQKTHFITETRKLEMIADGHKFI